jgi:hypothetical protein
MRNCEKAFNLHLSFLIVCYFVEFLLLSERQGFFFVPTAKRAFSDVPHATSSKQILLDA